MLKYVNYDIVFQEYPDEVTLAINLSLCPNACPGCHSAFLGGDVGEELTLERLLGIVSGYDGAITCVGFQGGDNDPQALMQLSRQLREAYPALRVGWYSGRQQLPSGVDASAYDYIKLGPWREALGPLSSPTTNQRMYRIHSGEQGVEMEDITHRFQRK